MRQDAHHSWAEQQAQDSTGAMLRTVRRPVPPSEPSATRTPAPHRSAGHGFHLDLVPSPPPPQQVVQLHRLQALCAWRQHQAPSVHVGKQAGRSSGGSKHGHQHGAPQQQAKDSVPPPPSSAPSACQEGMEPHQGGGGGGREGSQLTAEPLLQLLLAHAAALHPRQHPGPGGGARRGHHRLRRLGVQQLVPQRATATAGEGGRGGQAGRHRGWLQKAETPALCVHATD